MTIDATSAALAAVISAGTIAATAWKGRPAAAAALRYFGAWFTLPARVAAIDTLTSKELRHNGGSSIRDVVTRLAGELGTNQARSRALLAHMGVAYWESDAAGNCSHTSRELLRLTGRQADEVLGRGWVSTIHAAQRDAVVKEWDSCVHDGRDFGMDYSFVTPCGDEVPVRAEATVIRDQAGRLVGFVGRIEERTPRA